MLRTLGRGGRDRRPPDRAEYRRGDQRGRQGRDHGQRPDQPDHAGGRTRRRPRPAAAPARRRPARRGSTPRRRRPRRKPAAPREPRRRGLPVVGRGGGARRSRLAARAAIAAACGPAQPLVAAGRQSRRRRRRARKPRADGPSGSTIFEVPGSPRLAHGARRRHLRHQGPGTDLPARRLRDVGVRTRTVDLSTSQKPSPADVRRSRSRAIHPRGSSAVFSGDRGRSVEAMAEAFARWIVRERDIGGVISAGGSGGTSLATAGMRRAAGRRSQADGLDGRVGRRRPLCRRRPTS